MTLFKKTTILALLAIFFNAPLAATGEDEEEKLPDAGEEKIRPGEEEAYEPIPAAAAVADESVAGGGGSASAAPSESGHTYSEEATAKLIKTLQDENGLWSDDIDLEKLQHLLDDGADVNTKDVYEQTLLIHAAGCSWLKDIIQPLLDKGANINARDKYGETALISAVKDYNLPMVRLLLDKGADVNIQDKKGRTALILAAKDYNLRMVQPLLEKDANVNIQDVHRKTALMYAVRRDKVDIVERLLNKGADVGITDNKGKTALNHVVDVEQKNPNARKIRELLINATEASAPLYVLK